MTDLRHRGTPAAVEPTVDDQPAANAGADRHVEDRSQTASCPQPGFGQGGGIAVVPQHDRQSETVAAPLDEREIIPAFDLMTGQDSSPVGVNRSAKTDADAPHPGRVDQLPTSALNLLEDTAQVQVFLPGAKERIEEKQLYGGNFQLKAVLF